VARSHDSTVITEHGTVLGTAAYLAPEQARGEQVTPAADLYSLGVVLYEALTGRLPHKGESVPELLLRRERDAPTPVRAFAPEVPPELEDGITQCLARRPEDRPASAAGLGDLLLGSLTNAPTRPLAAAGDRQATRAIAPGSARTAVTRLMSAGRPRKRMLAVPAALLLAALAITLGVWAGGGDTVAAPTASPSAPSSAPPPAPPSPAALQPPPVALQPEPAAPPACDQGDGNGRGHGKGKGKAKGHDKHDRVRDKCED
jgi:serine/threonine-protein kinase